MRRGLISWSRAELPEAVLDHRVAAAQAGMRERELDALVVYTTPARAAGVSWLAGFVPYWNQGLLVVPATGRPILVSALSNRVADWLQRNAHVESVRNSPRIGAEAATFIAKAKPKATVGLVDLQGLPAAIIAEIAAAGHQTIDASELLAGLRMRPDPADLALHARAAAIGLQALGADLSSAVEANEVAAELDRVARLAGAEEVYPGIAADLSKSLNPVRIEGGQKLGQRFAVRLSLSYKGAWVRLTRTLDQSDGGEQRLKAAAEAFATSVASLPDTRRLAVSKAWLIEATATTMPLEPRAGSRVENGLAVEPGSLVNVQATLSSDGQPVLLGGPVLVGSAGAPSSLLVAPIV